MANMTHEAVAKDLTRKAVKLLRAKQPSQEIEVCINSSTHYLRSTGAALELWSAEKLAEIPSTASEPEIFTVFLDYLNHWMSRSYSIEYFSC